MGGSYDARPLNIPTAPIYLSYVQQAYHAIGDQGGWILNHSIAGLGTDGTQYPYAKSNDFAQALDDCSNTCDSNPTCQSFNIFTAYEDDFNNGVPTFECRFSPHRYNHDDYTHIYNGYASYVWSLSTEPYNLPTDDNYVSEIGRDYLAYGDQSGLILNNTWHDLWVDGRDLRISNDYGYAVSHCAAKCDSQPQCLSFNVATVSYDYFNNGRPTFTCSFSPKFYSHGDYRVNNTLPSYVWSQRPTDIDPSCNLAKEVVDPSQALWVERRMDDYLWDYAAVNGILGNNVDFTKQLMLKMGYSGYQCDTDPAHQCQPESIDSCRKWLHFQIANFESYMIHSIDLIDQLQDAITEAGQVVFYTAWYKSPPAKPTLDAGQLARTVLSNVIAVISFVPGPVTSILGLSTLLQNDLTTYLKPDATQPVTVEPDKDISWAEYVADVFHASIEAAKIIDDYRSSATKSPALFPTITLGGNWSRNGVSTPTPFKTVWDSVEQYYKVKIASQAMKAQSVFLLKYPTTGKCTQAGADNVGNLFNPPGSASQSGVAFCNVDNTAAIVPIVGYNLELYSPFPSVLKNTGMTKGQDVLDPSAACYPGFGTTTLDIDLYKRSETDAFPLDKNAITKTTDLKQPCAWNIPVCDFNIWTKQVWYDNGAAPTYNDSVRAVAEYCGFQWGMRSSVLHCETYPGSGGSYGGTLPYHVCKDWHPVKIVNCHSLDCYFSS